MSSSAIAHRLHAAVRVGVGLCLTLAFLAPSAPAQAQLTVAHAGTPSYSHGLAVPPGLAGMTPQLAFVHDANRANGPLGHGWSLQGPTAITRCPGILAIDGAARKPVAHTADDKLCLDGRLVQTDATGTVAAFPQSNDSLGLASGTREYRTERDSFARIRAYGMANGSAANGPAYFKVWTKSGQILEYGVNANATANANITAAGSNVVIAWALSRASDAQGNYIDYQYDQRTIDWGSATTPATPGREWNLVEARYTGTPVQAPTHKLTFVYEDRAATAPTGLPHDRAETYVLGAKHVSVRRLAKVEAYSNTQNTPIKGRTWKLAYDNGPVSNRSRLQSITECADTAGTLCLPPTRFEHEPGAGVAYAASTVFDASPLDTLVMHSGALGTPPYYGATPPRALRHPDGRLQCRRQDGPHPLVRRPCPEPALCEQR